MNKQLQCAGLDVFMRADAQEVDEDVGEHDPPLPVLPVCPRVPHITVGMMMSDQGGDEVNVGNEYDAEYMPDWFTWFIQSFCMLHINGLIIRGSLKRKIRKNDVFLFTSLF